MSRRRRVAPRSGDAPRPYRAGMTISPEWRTAIDEYLTAQRAAGMLITTMNSRRQHLQHMARRVPKSPWEMTSDDLVVFTGAQTWATETRRGRCNTFRSFWRWAKHTKRAPKNIAKVLVKVKPGEPDPRPVPDRVYRKALMKADADETIWLELAHDHGLRRCEVAVVHSDDIHEDLIGYSLLVHGKGSKKRVVPLTPGMARKLLDREPGWAFPGDDNGHLSPRWIGKLVAGLLDGDWTMHKLRHSAGTAFYLHGDLAIAQKLLGHASPATTMIYVKLPDESLRRTVMAAAS